MQPEVFKLYVLQLVVVESQNVYLNLITGGWGGRETVCKLHCACSTTRVSDLLIKERLAIGFGGYITENLR